MYFDSGATCCVVEKRLVKESDITGKETPYNLTDGCIDHFPTAKIEIESEYFRGQLEALVIEKPFKPIIIIGNINRLKFLLSKDRNYPSNMFSTNDERCSEITEQKTLCPECKRVARSDEEDNIGLCHK